MKNKFMCLLLGILLVTLMVGTVSAVVIPTVMKPHIRDFAYDETRIVFRPFLSIFVDKETINLGESATYTISLTTTAPDSDYTDGTYQVQYAGWVFADKDGNMIKNKEFTRVYGSFSDTVIVKPTAIGEYALVGLIIQYDQVYDSVTSSWITSPEDIKVKEAKKLTVTTPEPPTPPTPGIIGWLGNAWDSIVNWFKGLFG